VTARGRSLSGERRQILGFVKDDTRQRIELAHPRLAREHRLRVRLACFPTLPDSGLAEIDVLGVVLVVQLRREQLDHVHAGLTAQPSNSLTSGLLRSLSGSREAKSLMT
jgi:hypothetical protein